MTFHAQTQRKQHENKEKSRTKTQHSAHKAILQQSTYIFTTKTKG